MKEKNVWFKAKRYGWGWYPATWQGWAVITLYVVYMVYRAQRMQDMFDTWTSMVWRYVFELIIPTALLLALCYWKGEKPRWRWGGK